MNLSRASLLSATALLAASGFAQVDPRASLRLDTGWQSVLAPHGPTPPAEGWRTAAVPGFSDLSPQGRSRDLWYRRQLRLPSGWNGRRVFLDLRGARYDPHVYLDGRLLARQFDGWSPMEVELPSLQEGKTYELWVRCQDWGATFPEGYVWPSGTGEDALRGKVFAPVGGYKNHFGMVSPAWLRARPRYRLRDDDLRIETSVRKGELSVSGLAEAPAGARVRVEVWSKGRRALALPTVPVDGQGRWNLRARFPKPRYWSPEDPFLYELRVSLRNGAEQDRVQKRFGFREFWTQGPHFYLNGVRRNLFASATWPVTEWLSPAEVRKRVRAAKAGGIDTFRMHIGPWQEEFGEAADEIGLLMVGESAVYTDGSGFYAYGQPLFWRRYREHLAAIVRRDRNHPSLVMWSLGNEILFMGNERYDAALPKKLGDLARYVRTLDPSRPLTFEADIDPDGAYDVVGLHYPHELPNQYAYPQTGDWLGTRKQTEAAGGMLGQKSSGFQWDRKKPLYIGEYLWVPQGDYSPGTVYFGDDAYWDREGMNLAAKVRSWIDQTIAYRRAGVSALSPWTAMEFGMLPGPKQAMDAQRVYFRRQAAFLRDRGLRFFSGERTRLRFDVFNDAPRAARMELQLVRGDGKVSARQTVRLEPAGYAEIALPFRAMNGALRYRLLADGREVDGGTLPVTISPRAALPAATVYDPSGRWPGSVTTLADLSPEMLLLIAPGALGTAGQEGVPTVGASTFDGARFREFVAQGGRAVVLEQTTLAPLGVGVSLVEHPSTMTFPITSHALWQGVPEAALKHWRGDGYVSRYEIRREGAYGLRAIAVSGGPDSLAQTPMAEMSYGRGSIVFLQARVGEKRNVEPAARQILTNALNYRPEPARSGPLLFVGEEGDFLRQLRAMGMRPTLVTGALSPEEAMAAGGIVLSGGGPAVMAARDGLAAAVRRGPPIYWHLPTPEAFRALRDTLGRPDLDAVEERTGPALRMWYLPSMTWVTREDLTFTTPPVGWNRLTFPKADVGAIRFAPTQPPTGPVRKLSLAGATIEKGRLTREFVHFPRRGEIRFAPDASRSGFRRLTIEARGTPGEGQRPMIEVRVDGRPAGWLDFPSEWTRRYVDMGPLEQSVSLRFVNGGDWGGPRTLQIREVSVSEPFKGVTALVEPGVMLFWNAHPLGPAVYVDGMAWEQDPESLVRGRRYLSAMFGGLGYPFAHAPVESGEALPTSGFRTTGGQYNTATAERIELRSTGTAEIEFAAGSEGSYGLTLVGSSTPSDGEYARVQVYVDDVLWGERTTSAADARYDLEPRRLTKGRHRLRLVFPNDASNATEDRNLTVRSVLLGLR